MWIKSATLKCTDLAVVLGLGTWGGLSRRWRSSSRNSRGMRLRASRSFLVRPASGGAWAYFLCRADLRTESSDGRTSRLLREVPRGWNAVVASLAFLYPLTNRTTLSLLRIATDWYEVAAEMDESRGRAARLDSRRSNVDGESVEMAGIEAMASAGVGADVSSSTGKLGRTPASSRVLVLLLSLFKSMVVGVSEVDEGGGMDGAFSPRGKEER
ncbi:hypothetical protein H257_00172 [Aphanomyces astaci]|uniref:Uncharacterized protein n=1 Tax=Aphanomyces astaci TaxID=112090 RepID=W4HBZ0_APHAT|nr:hypothetical protein H257_00172 [Aphanomyces astaci]ETV88628.1 hypothetical protein H257_00172 [Aphanomyces astaci]|eukprot:XP_009821028.1 hypothetical protein H257_00172 [Aphanomyces astaci]